MDIGDSTSAFRATTYSPGTAGTLTFDATSGNAILNKINTASTLADTISAPIILNDHLDITNASATAPLVISGGITQLGGAKNLTKLGAGLVTLSGTSNYTGITTASAGTLAITSPAALYNSNGSGGWTSSNIVVSANALLNLSYGGSGFSSSTSVRLPILPVMQQVHFWD